jgi:hypothetical protein
VFEAIRVSAGTGLGAPSHLLRGERSPQEDRSHGVRGSIPADFEGTPGPRRARRSGWQQKREFSSQSAASR